MGQLVYHNFPFPPNSSLGVAGVAYSGGKWFVEEPRPIVVKDRIGGGDGFTGGLIYGVLNVWNGEKCLQFGWASGVLAASSLNDYTEPADEKQV